MEIKTCVTGQNKYLLKITGKITTDVAYVLSQAIYALPQNGSMILDFSGTTYICSSGMRILLQAKKSYSSRMYVTGMHGTVLEAVKITGFDHILGIMEGTA